MLLSRFKLMIMLLSSVTVTSVSLQANSLADTETLDANQHVIMFERGVDAYMAGRYDDCDEYWWPLARAGDAMAAYNLGLLYYTGKGVNKDLDTAENFYRYAADRGVTAAQSILGLLYIKGDDFKRNLPEAVKYLTAASQAGDAIAAWNLGLLYENGFGVNKNSQKALSLFHKAARGGHELALSKVTGVENNGYTEPKDLKEKANIDAVRGVDDIFDTGENYANVKPKRLSEKKKLFEENEKKNFSDRINFVKKLQKDEPDIVFRDEALEYDKRDTGVDREIDPFGLSKSRKNREGDILSLETIGDNLKYVEANQAYLNKDYPKAIALWIELFKEEKSDEAAYRLGKIYEKGIDEKDTGVEKDLVKMYYYWKKGAEAGGQKCSYELETFKSTLSDKEFLRYEQETITDF
jgi:tetratricopeptide (TPR) repeat protein